MKSRQELKKATLEELRIFPTLRNLSEKSLLQLSEVLIPMHLPKGGTIQRVGNKEKYLFLLKSGTVKIKVQVPNQEDIVIRKVKPPQIFGQAALLQNSTRKLSFVAKGESFLYVLPTHLHQWAIDRGMLWAMELQRVLCVQLIQQMRKTLDSLRELAQNEENNENKKQALIELLNMTEISATEIKTELL